MKLELINGIWTDENNNRAIYGATEEQAIKQLSTLKNCKDCWNCLYCVDCTDCRSCRDCRRCTECKDCYECTECNGYKNRAWLINYCSKVETIEEEGAK